MAFRVCRKYYPNPCVLDNHDRLQENRDDSDAVGDEREGGLSWLKAAITSDKKVAATPSAVAMGHKSVDESKSTQGTRDTSARV